MASSSTTVALEDEEPWTDKSLPLHNLDTLAEQEDPLYASNNASASSKRKSTAYLDGLRGLAALMVYLYHHISWFYGPTNDLVYGWGHEGRHHLFQLPFLRVFFSGGNAAVAIFFILSGYVLSVSPLRSIREGHLKRCYTGLLSATIRRPFRLYIPPAAVGLSFAICMHLPFGLAPRLAWPEPESSLWAELLRYVPETWQMINPFIKHGVKEHWYIYNPPSYTMAIEFVGSMAVYSLCFVSSQVSVPIRAGLFVLAGVTFLVTYQWAMAMFMGGVLLAMNDLENWDQALLSKLSHRISKTTAYHIVFFTGWYLLCQPSGVYDPAQSSEAPGWYFLTQLIPKVYLDDEFWRFWNFWGAFFLVYGVLRISYLQTFFASRPLKYLGRICFALYLVHTPLLWTLNDRIYRIFGQRQHQDITLPVDDLLKVPDFGFQGLTTRFLIAQVFITPVNLIFAELGTILLDLPSVKAGKWIVKKLGVDKR